MSSEIFLITTMKGTFSFLPNSNKRCVGFLETLDEAIREVEANSGDMYEGDFKYAVIEKCGPGIYFLSEAVRWYEWKGTHDSGGYVQCERPERYKGVANFAIG